MICYTLSERDNGNSYNLHQVAIGKSNYKSHKSKQEMGSNKVPWQSHLPNFIPVGVSKITHQKNISFKIKKGKNKQR